MALRTALAVLAALATAALTLPAGASGAGKLGRGKAHAITAHDGQAWVAVESGPASDPYALVRTSGGRGTEERFFGARDAIFPTVAAGPAGRVHFLFGRSISGGERYWLGRGVDDPEAVGHGTGPGRLWVGPDGPQLAYPDREGDATLDGAKLTFDAPHRRHLPLDLESGLVLDMAQTRKVTELRVLGEGAPKAAVDVASKRRALSGTLAVDGDRLFVAYTKRGRAYIAQAALDPEARWTRRRLPGGGGSSGSAAVVRAKGRTYVAYSQQGEMYVYDGRLRRLTRSRGSDGSPVAAGDAGGSVFVAWTRRSKRSGRDVALVASAARGGSVTRR